MGNQHTINEEKKYSFNFYFIIIFIIITIALVILRIFLYFFEISEWIQQTKDIDFKILIAGMDNNLIDFYDPVPISDWPPYYLYFWYFIFYLIYIIPFNTIIGVYIWDVLRLALTILVVKESPKIFKNKKDLLIFYLMCIVGYSIDAYYNNVNFLILFLLFYSYVFFERDRKWIAGILFTLATFKITALLFLPILLIIKKVKWKDLIYFLVPLFVICIPYLIFPDYFFQMLNNWGHSDAEIRGFLFIDSILWKALQPSHLTFIGLLFIIFLENIKNEKNKNLYRIILVSIITIYYVYLTTIVFVIPVILA
ncbi:MAG: glycosyltransferase 87 family protein [Candidatus Hodarchaeota archaeon]